MRRQREGTIVNISSIAGRIGLPLNSPYASSKFALEGLSESMAYENRTIWNKSSVNRTRCHQN
jgi:short-subunit dehydrogenase